MYVSGYIRGRVGNPGPNVRLTASAESRDQTPPEHFDVAFMLHGLAVVRRNQRENRGLA